MAILHVHSTRLGMLRSLVFSKLKYPNFINHPPKKVNNDNVRRRWEQYRRYSTQLKHEQIIEAWFYEVNPFGKIDISVPCDINVQPLNPLEYPQMDKLICEIYQTTPENTSQSGYLNKLYKLDIDMDDKKEDVKVKIAIPEGVFLPILCNIKLPIKYNLTIKGKDRNVSVEQFECDYINISTNTGDCKLHKIKSNETEVTSLGGNIMSESLLQGNIHLTTDNLGTISGERFQGQSIKCHTETGNINIKTLYADNTDIETKSGIIHLGSCHGNTVINSHGNITIDSVDGNLTSNNNNGNTDVYIARCGQVIVTTQEGDLDIKLGENIQVSTLLQASNLNISSDLNYSTKHSTSNSNSQCQSGTINGGSEDNQLVMTSMKGSIKLELQDWFSSLKLSS